MQTLIHCLFRCRDLPGPLATILCNAQSILLLGVYSAYWQENHIVVLVISPITRHFHLGKTCPSNAVLAATLSTSRFLTLPTPHPHFSHVSWTMHVHIFCHARLQLHSGHAMWHGTHRTLPATCHNAKNFLLAITHTEARAWSHD